MIIRGDCHVHLRDEDRFREGDIERIVHCAHQEKGYSFIVICDHNRVGPSLEVKRYAENLKIPFVVVTGSEVDTSEGSVGCWNIYQDIPAGIGIKETCELVHKLGGVVIKVHPEDAGVVKRNALYLDGYEVRNGRHSDIDINGLENLKMFKCKGSDAHGYLEFKEKIYFAELSIKNLSIDEIVKSIASCKSSE